jgi:hypothetical protein
MTILLCGDVSLTPYREWEPLDHDLGASGRVMSMASRHIQFRLILSLFRGDFRILFLGCACGGRRYRLLLAPYSNFKFTYDLFYILLGTVGTE